MPTDPVVTGRPPAPYPSASAPPSAPPAPPAPAPAGPGDTFEVKADGGSVKLEKKGDAKKEVKKEVSRKGGDEVPDAKKPAGPSATVIDASAKAKAGSDVGPGASVTGKFDVSVNTSGLDVNGSLKLDAHLLKLSGKVEKTFEFEYGGEKFRATVALNGDLKIGGDANLKLNFHVGTDGVVRLNLGADGFVGARGELKGTVKLESRPAGSPDSAYAPLFEGGASVSAYAGAAAGAKFNVTGDVRSGKLGFEAKAFASAGVGVGFGVDGSINVKNIADVAGRVGLKFLKDAGNAVNLPGATMDYLRASREASALDQKLKPITGRAHAIDAWNRQGYSGLLPSEQLSKATGALSYYKSYDMVDTASGIGRKDGIISHGDLVAAYQNERFPDSVRAAAWVLSQPGMWDKVNTGGFISKADGANPWAKAISPETKKALEGEDRVESARRAMAGRQTDLQRRFGGLSLELMNAQTPDQLKAVVAKIDAELGGIEKWGDVTQVQGGCGHDAVCHEQLLRQLREQAMAQLNTRKAG
jgi:hypothetical protein